MTQKNFWLSKIHSTKSTSQLQVGRSKYFCDFSRLKNFIDKQTNKILVIALRTELCGIRRFGFKPITK